MNERMFKNFGNAVITTKIKKYIYKNNGSALLEIRTLLRLDFIKAFYSLYIETKHLPLYIRNSFAKYHAISLFGVG